MADSYFEMSIDLSSVDRCAEDTLGKLRQIVSKTAFDLKSEVQSNIVRQDLIDTGYGLNSVAVIDSNEALAFHGDSASQFDTGFNKDVIVIAWYMAVHEYGRIDGTIPARPFFRPAVETVRTMFDLAVQAVLNGAG